MAFENRTIPREGVIIEWTLNGLFHDARDVILTSPTDVMEMEDNDNELTLVGILRVLKMLLVDKITISNGFNELNISGH